ncbi:hypothetical protein [Streptomyces sp. NPDC088766]|uniref:hypothetical protein n=1 Tax=Streptomyces sp. NPDC088766 TaxID=3365893 RepID=UPI003810F550
MTTRAERALAAEQWLLTAAPDRSRARAEWLSDGVALLRCGGAFGAVRMSAPLVHVAARTDNLVEVDRYLAKALLGGPVFMDQESGRYYALVGISTGRRPEWKRTRDDAEYLGQNHYLGVPALSATDPVRRSYWCVPMDSAGILTVADAVSQLVHTGRERLANDRRG